MIRQAQKDDCAELAKVHVASWRDAYRGILPDTFLNELDVVDRVKRWIELLIKKSHRVFLHFEGERLLGFASICPCRDKDAEKGWGEISSVYYLSDFWGKGFAPALMDTALIALLQLGYSKITLWVLRNNSRARSFYQKYDLSPDGTERKFEINGVEFDEIRMAC